LPPLRSRSADVFLLVLHFLGKLLRGEDQTIKRVSWDLIDSLSNMNLHGNVRELENMLTRSVFQTEGHRLSANTLMLDEITDSPETVKNTSAMEPTSIRPLWELEKEALQFTLEKLNGNISQAATQLQISRTAIYRKIKKYDLKFSDTSPVQGTEDA